jgi:hypothetical protein
LETCLHEVVMQFLLRPAAHDEIIGCGCLHIIPPKRVVLCHQQLPPVMIELSHATEGELAVGGINVCLEHRFAFLPTNGLVPLAHIEDERARWAERPGKGEEDFLTAAFVKQVVKHPTAEDAIIRRRSRQGQDIADCK